MRLFSLFFLCVVLVLSNLPGNAQSRTGYVTDMLILTFRQGPGPSYQVLKTLESNTPLTILNEEAGYFQVQLSSGETGWVDKQFVMFEPPKILIIETLKEENMTLRKQLTEMSDAHDRLKDQVAVITEKSGDIIQIVEKNDALEQENQQLSKKIAQLSAEPGHPFKTDMLKWFLAGFGVIFVGWFLGQRVSGRTRKRSSLLD
ncbi:MAG: TIGR04211 family SH3 domain-containing protein [Desulfotignum sp.]